MTGYEVLSGVYIALKDSIKVQIDTGVRQDRRKPMPEERNSK
jgi:hypothetical protein